MLSERAEVASSRDLERARHYEHATLARLFDTHYDPLHGFIFALLGDSVAAEEVASLVFQRLLDALGTITGQGAGVEGWLYTTALALAGQRRRHSRPQGLAGALWELPAHEREVLALRLLARLDVDRVAAATGVAPDAVVSTQASALKRLSAQMVGRR
jgi:DNA-directed RNA polymerase specialized sigma24 family protein